MSFIKIDPNDFRSYSANVTVSFFGGTILVELDAPGDLTSKLDTFLDEQDVSHLLKVKFDNERTFAQIWFDMNKDDESEREEKYTTVQKFVNKLFTD